ncbi:helix-turn-helix domain-containing protein [Gayadomonas joobiniege]|uniref:helix-turn-helix domain-containing protein n=1 Tax=Gayadomonas joobiniege TaxID=1234606 RepID=UPI00036D734F|nr:helix-turn-helix domain-containing protein [Gayadomonas joobiniege]
MQTIVKKSYKPNKNELLSHLNEIKNSQTIGRSKVNCKLLSYLVEHYLSLTEQESDYKPPKEIELAVKVFDRESDFNPAEDAFVRVYISNLRKKLKTYYQTEGEDQKLKINIPPGGYGLNFSYQEKLTNDKAETDDEKVLEIDAKQNQDLEASIPIRSTKTASTSKPIEPVGEVANTRQPDKSSEIKSVAIIGLTLLLILSLAANWLLIQAEKNTQLTPYQEVRKHPLWQPLLNNDKSTLLVIGNLYMLHGEDPETGRAIGIRDYNINSDQDLELFFSEYPHKRGKLRPGKSPFLLKNSVFAAKHLLPLFSDPRKINIKLISDLTPDDLRDFNLIYLGLYKSLGTLDVYLRGSNLHLDQYASRLTDKKSGKVYSVRGNPHQEYTDYGVFARFNGPSGNLIMTFAGFSDASVIQMARFLTNPKKLYSKNFIHHFSSLKQSGNSNFELMFSTSGYDRTDLGSEVISSNKLDEKAIWAMPK